jgi:ferric-dicitrate binding protein FerR (iron transport regulator)
MNNDKKNLNLDDAIQAMRRDEAPESVAQAAAARAWQKINGGEALGETVRISGCEDIRALLPVFRARDLSAERILLVEDHLHECIDCRRAYQQDVVVPASRWKEVATASSASFWDPRRYAIAAALLVVVGVSALGLNWYLAPLPGDRAHLQSAQGPVYLIAANTERPLLPGVAVNEGDIVRTGAGTHALIQLFDGSVVEMNERAEFSVSARRRATTIHLSRGRIIVQAAKQHGHLYVSTDTAKVSVTGTVFSVDNGLKGTRVSVIEGEVHVDDNGGESVLHSGDQVATSASMGEVPIEEEISWSQNREQHLALLAEFSKLQKKFESIPSPALRYDSAILPIAPDGALIYASVPNYGEQIAEANRMFQDELSNSDVLRQWWEQNQLGKDQAKFKEMIERIRTLGQYLGNEVVFMLVPSPYKKGPALVIAAQVTRPGLRDYLQAELNKLETDPTKASHVVILADEDAATTVVDKGSLAIMAGSKLLLASNDGQLLQSLAARQAQGGGSTEFAATAFGQAIAASYQEGAGLVFAANLEEMIHQQQGHAAASGNVNARKHAAAFNQSGFGQARFLVAKRREENGAMDTRATLSFSSERSGIASWIAAPSGIGALDFVSPDASVVAAGAVKAPAQMVDDMFAMMNAAGQDPSAHRAEFRAQANFDMRDDFAAALGGDFAMALDGPAIPTPAWKLIVEVNDQSKLQSTITLLVQKINDEAAKHNRPGITLDQLEQDGRIFYTVKSAASAIPLEIDYTYESGYLVAGPSRALVLQSISVRNSGVTLTKSATFISLLPKDQHTNVSGIVYQNLASVAAPLMEQMNPNEAQSFQTIVGNARPSLLVAYGDSDRIELATTGRYFGFDVNNMALAQLLHLSGTKRGQAAY